jgi:hypothetical protein
MSSSRVVEEAKKIQESCSKLQNMTQEGDIRNELEKIKQYCSAIEAQI